VSKINLNELTEDEKAVIRSGIQIVMSQLMENGMQLNQMGFKDSSEHIKEKYNAAKALLKEVDPIGELKVYGS
jgi:hypothetical protein